MGREFHIKTAVAFIVFNRPETTQRVFAAIREARPPILLVVADGARDCYPGEAEKCAATRAIIENVDWPCKVLKNYSGRNLGCRARVSSGLDWVFENVDEAIVLEDDCLPEQSFFGYCEKMLEFYRDDERIMHIGGTNFQCGRMRGDGSYYFSRLNHIWGWATWKRAWMHYDVAMTSYPRFIDCHGLGDIISDRGMQKAWSSSFTKIYSNQLDTWDYQWTYALWQQNGLSIIPNVNLISNIGFGDNATHTIDNDNPFANVPLETMSELVHPAFMVPDSNADKFTFNVMTRVTLRRLFIKWFRKIIRSLHWNGHA